MIEQRPQRLPIALRVEQHDGFCVQAKLPPCQHLEEFVERPGHAGQHYDGIGIHEHDLLALMHGLGHDKGAQVALACLARHQMDGDDPQVLPARRLHGPRDRPHQPDITRAIDQPPAVARQHRAKVMRRRAIGGLAAHARSAENADRFRMARHDVSRGSVKDRICMIF